MKKGLLNILLRLFSFAGYANKRSKYLHEENYENSFTICNKKAEEGDAEAQFNLALMYEKGDGIKQDKQKALYWYTKAAEQGLFVAQNNLGFMYNEGEGIEQDKQKAIYWLTKAAEQGHFIAQTNLAHIYFKGTAQDKVKAVYWYTKAAE